MASFEIDIVGVIEICTHQKRLVSNRHERDYQKQYLDVLDQRFASLLKS